MLEAAQKSSEDFGPSNRTNLWTFSQVNTSKSTGGFFGDQEEAVRSEPSRRQVPEDIRNPSDPSGARTVRPYPAMVAAGKN
eukprot:s2183_g15.t3